MSFRHTLRRVLLVFPTVGAALAQQQYAISTFAGGTPPAPTAATSAAIGGLAGVATDHQGNVYFTALDCVFRLSTTGSLTVVAGTSRQGYSGDGGLATSAQLNDPWGVAVDSAGNLYVGDAGNYRVRKISSAGIITTVAGNGTELYSGEGGQATSASLSAFGLAIDSAGNLYIADAGNSAVRKVSAAGIITTIAGNGVPGYTGDGGVAANAELDDPLGVAVDSSGNLYIADTSNSVIRKVSSGVISTIAGNGNFGYSGDGGPAIAAELESPYGVTVDSSGNLYVIDTENFVIRKISGGTISTIAGSGFIGFSGDGGSATSATLGLSFGIAVDPSGNVYVADAENLRLREVSSGAIKTIAGDGLFNYGGDGGLARNAQVGGPHALAIDSSGNIYIADTPNSRIRKVATSGVITTVAGTGTAGFAGDGGQATSAELDRPQGVAIDNAGNLYIADTGNNAIRKVSTSGVISTLAGHNGYSNTGDGGPAISAALAGPTAVLPDNHGNLYIADTGSAKVRIISSAGVITTFAGSVLRGYAGDGGPANAAYLSYPSGLALDSQGNLYIADAGNNAIREVTAANGNINTIAGIGDTTAGYSGDGGLAANAYFDYPTGLAFDTTGNLYIADSLNRRVREIFNNFITTVAGNGVAAWEGDGGQATAGSLVEPWGIVLDSSGNIYVADTAGGVRLLRPSLSTLFLRR